MVKAQLNFFICPNGFGHLNRCVSLAKFLILKNFKIRFFIDEIQINIIDKFTNGLKIEILPLRKNFLLFDFDINYFNRFVKSHISINDFNIIDTNYDILPYLNKSILLANFLWSEVISLDEQKNLIYKNNFNNFNGPIFGNNIFAMDTIKLHKNFIGYDFKKRLVKKKIVKDYLLISCGGTNYAFTKFKNKFNYFYSLSKKFKYTFIEPRLCNLFEKKINFISADYSDKMFDKVNYAIIRPGLGTIEKLFSRSIPFDCIFEPYNKEMTHNQKISRNLGISGSLKNFFQLNQNYSELNLNNKTINYLILNYLSSRLKF